MVKRLRKILKARELRENQTKAENILWKHLRDRKFFGKKFRRQHIINGFIVDFYCFEDKLAIELDGLIHERQKDYDQMRQEIIETHGIKILRIKNRELFENTKNVLTRIKEKLSLSSFAGEGR